ncbi:RNA polymerase sigma factor FliA [Chromobacterium aquaticum]|nr:RNA polymerase sigma factor FliA [Chromobacterium aquaticum]
MRQYAHLVKRVARQLSSQAGGVFDREDMEQVGLMALLESLRRYGEPDDKFAGFAILRIRGAILDELRRLDWRPRSVRQEAHRVRDGLRLLSRKLGREPSEAEAMQLLGLSAEAYQEALLADNAEALASFDELMAAGMEPASEDNPEQRLALKSALTVALQALNPREQQVIQLYYEFELSLKEIAAVLALTEARVCQINKSALKKMQACLQAA